MCLGATTQFGEPPAQANKEKSPVFEEFWRLAFEGMADKLQNPSTDEQSGERLPPAGIDEQERCE